jgi:hypothetical protein
MALACTHGGGLLTGYDKRGKEVSIQHGLRFDGVGVE